MQTSIAFFSQRQEGAPSGEKARLLRALANQPARLAPMQILQTGLAALDEMIPAGTFRCGAVHELLAPPRIFPTSIALLLARAAQQRGGAVAWLDPDAELYLPAAAAAGIDLHRLILLRCAQRREQLWALAECLRCRGVCATVGFIPSLSQIEARRLQLAAEHGGGVGLFMRPHRLGTHVPYAAATRWLIAPAPGDEHVQRWRVQLLHGHGGQTQNVLLLEIDRDTRNWTAIPLHSSALLSDRPAAPPPVRITG